MVLKNTFWLAAASLFLIACGDQKPDVVQWMNGSETELSLPATPSKIALYNPAKSPGKITTPTLKVSGVKPGQYVYIYKSSLCKAPIKYVRAGSTSALIKLSALANGSYKFYTKAKNKNGYSKCKGYVAYTVDTVAPVLSIGAPSVSTINTGNVDYAVTYSGASSINLIAANVTVNATGTVTYTKSVLNGTTSTPTVRITITGGDGTVDSISIGSATSHDQAGNTDIGSSNGTDVTVNNTAPIISITTPGYINNGNKTSYSFSGTCNENGDTITITAPASVSGTTTTCSSLAFTFTNLDVHTTPDGTVNFTASIQDTIGNSSNDTKSATKDTSDPAISSLSLSSPATSPGNYTTPDIQVAGIFPVGDSFQLFSDATCSTSISSSVAATGANSIILTSNTLIANTAYTYYAKGTDAAGNTSCSGAGVSVSYTLDTVNPTITITTPMSYINNANKNTYTYAGTCSENGQTVSMTSPISTTTACSAGTFTFSNLDLHALTDGSKSFTVGITDTAGNTGSNSANATKDTVNPTVTITSLPVITVTNQSSYSISGACTANGDTVSITSPALVGSTTCAGGAYIISGVNVSGLADGTANFTIQNQDAAGNQATASSSTTKDTTSPTDPSCTGLGSNATPTKSDTITWTGSTDATSGINHYEMIIIDNNNGSTAVDWTNIGSTVTPYQFTGISPKLMFKDGYGGNQINYAVYVRAVDNVGLTSGNAACPLWHLKPAYGNFIGNQTTNGDIMNESTAYPLVYSASTYNASYLAADFNSEKILINEPGNYLLSFTLPVVRKNGNATGTAASAKNIVYVNGTAYATGFAANSFTRGKTSALNPIYGSNHMTVLLENLKSGDVVRITTENNADASEILVVPSGSKFSAYFEYIPDEQEIFNAVAVDTTGGPDLNSAVEEKYQWTHSILDDSFKHDNAANPENIIFAKDGDYLISVNVPIEGSGDDQKVEAHIYVDGNDQFNGSFTIASNDYISNINGHLVSSTNYTNVLYGITAGSTLDVRTIQLGALGPVNIANQTNASIYIQRVDTASNYYAGRGEFAFNWNSANTIKWLTDFIIDTTYFTSPAGSPDIVIIKDGDYMAFVSDRMSGDTDYQKPITRINVNGTPYAGAECSSHNLMATPLEARTDCDMQILLKGLHSGDVVTYTTEPDILAGTATGTPPKITLHKVSE